MSRGIFNLTVVSSFPAKTKPPDIPQYIGAFLMEATTGLLEMIIYCAYSDYIHHAIVKWYFFTPRNLKCQHRIFAVNNSTLQCVVIIIGFFVVGFF